MLHNYLSKITYLVKANLQCYKQNNFQPLIKSNSNQAKELNLTRSQNLSSRALISRYICTKNEEDIHTFSLLNTGQSKRFASIKRRSLKVVETQLADKYRMEWPKITLFGDSITRRSKDTENGCWGSMIAYKAGSFFDVDVRGFEGYNSRWALGMLPKLFPKSYLEKVEIFIPFFGHNDSWEERFPAHVPVDEYEVNMRSIIKYLTDNGLEKRKIILITPTWYHDESFRKFLTEIGMPSIGKDVESARKYSDAILRIAKDNDIDVIDFFEISLKQEPLVEIFCDGVHYSRKGAKLLFDLLMPIIEKKIEASFKKSLTDLWHFIPFDQHPDVLPVIQAYQESLKSKVVE